MWYMGYHWNKDLEIIGLSEKKNEEGGKKRLFKEIMAENF